MAWSNRIGPQVDVGRERYIRAGDRKFACKAELRSFATSPRPAHATSCGLELRRTIAHQILQASTF
eukprot:580286-Pyramimonas_sp.AAC.1